MLGNMAIGPTKEHVRPTVFCGILLNDFYTDFTWSYSFTWGV